ncbi:hypothetical protein QFC19_003077 [Naganishia cerealis]|uniref:Uncharacterized protein n=1 Tax=Naganishia cerealis TaxID=610337 RepID=A0ACC2W4T8_9TREE|nr:hypothetical protein QFC19_003077 [Naganishia cerealis]
MATFRRLVHNNQTFIAGLFQNVIQKPHQDDKTLFIPEDAKLRPTTDPSLNCFDSSFGSTMNWRDDQDEEYHIMVQFPDQESWGGAYQGDTLKAADGSDKSAWIFLFQEAMLHFAQASVQKEGSEYWKWSNTKETNVQAFNSEQKVQGYNDLGKMLKVTTGKKTSQDRIDDSYSDEKLETVLGSIADSPILVIPKAVESNDLPSDRIWVGMKKVKDEEKWTFFNPVEKNSKDLDLVQLRASARDIVYIKDHSAPCMDSDLFTPC